MTSYGSEPGSTPPGPGPQPTPPTPQPTPQPTQYAPPAPGYVPPPAVPPKRGTSPLLIIGIIVLALVLICGIGGALLVGGVLNATQPVADAGEAYMAALRDGNYSRAYDLSAPALQQEAGNAEGLQAVLGTKPLTSWSFNSRNISNNQGSLSGTTTYTDGSTGTVEMALTKLGNDWKVSGISLK